MKTVKETAREIPVLDEADVVVVGGGPGGIGAALAAARNGAKTILLEQFGSLGGLQTQGFNGSLFLVDPAIHGGIIWEVFKRLEKDGYVLYRTPMMAWFEHEYYKYLLDNMMAEAGVKLLYHVFAVGAVKDGNAIKGVIIENKEGRQAVLGKVVIDSTGSADIAWKSGTPCMGEEGFPSGPKKGRHSGFGYGVICRGVDTNRLQYLIDEQPDQWAGAFQGVMGGSSLIKKMKAEGKLYGNRGAFSFCFIHGPGRVMMMGPYYPLPLGRHSWMIEEITKGEIDLRKQTWSAYNLLKNNVPGFESSWIEQTPSHLNLRDLHRIQGEYMLKYEDLLEGKAFDDSIAVSNMSPDVFGPDDEHECTYNVPPHDIPYRCLVAQETDNLLAAGSVISMDFMTYFALRYCPPSMCTGQAAGTAAALSVKNKVTPRELDVKLLQRTLQDQGSRISVKHVAKEVLNEYQKKIANPQKLSLGPDPSSISLNPK